MSWPFEVDNVNNWAYMKDVFTPEECETIIKIANKKQKLNASVMVTTNNHKVDNKIRKNKVVWLESSDDLDWAEKNLPHQERITFIQSLDADDAVVQELKLMTSCQNHLIANSSLSWWGAWLGKDLNKTVICPKKWTNDMSANWDDLLPSTWTRI